MKKVIVSVALLFFIIGLILAFSIQETHTEEVVIDEWNPITPSILYPQNVTGWAFMALTSNGTYLELNISTSEDVRIIIGTLFYNETTGEEIWNNVIFNQTGTVFKQRVEFAGKNVDFLEIRNEGTTAVNITGDIKKIGSTLHPFYPYLGLGTLACLLGVIILIYGTFTKPVRFKKMPKNAAKSSLKCTKFFGHRFRFF